MGLDVAPGAGDRFHVLDDIGQAREIAATRADASSRESLSGNHDQSLVRELPGDVAGRPTWADARTESS